MQQMLVIFGVYFDSLTGFQAYVKMFVSEVEPTCTAEQVGSSCLES